MQHFRDYINTVNIGQSTVNVDMLIFGMIQSINVFIRIVQKQAIQLSINSQKNIFIESMLLPTRNPCQ